MILGLLLAAAGGGCAGQRQGPSETVKPASPLLLQLVPPVKTVNGVVVPPPVDFRRAETVFEQAAAAYRAGRFAAAAGDFLESARVFRGIAGWDDVDSPIASRRVSYRNAMYGFAAAEDLAGGRRALAAAAAEDPVCADEIQQLIRELEAWLRPPPP